MSGRQHPAVPSGRTQPVDEAAANRGSWRDHWRSIRLRLLLPIVVAALGLAGLGLAQTVSAFTAASDAARSRRLTEVAAAAVRLGHQIEQEVSETDALLARGGKAGAELLTAQRARTDMVLRTYQLAARAADTSAPKLAAVFKSVADGLSGLPQLRRTAMSKADDTPPPEQVYDRLARSLVALLDALPEQMSGAGLAEKAHAVGMLYSVEHIQSVQREMLRTVLLRHGFAGTELSDLAALRGAGEERMTQFGTVAGEDVRTLYTNRLSGTDVLRARSLLDSAINAGQDPHGINANALQQDPDEWYIVSSAALRRLYLVELHVINTLGVDANSAETMSRVRAIVTGVATTLVVFLTLAGAVLLAVRISKRLSRLRTNALSVAAAELPDSVAAVAQAPNADAVQEVITTSVRHVDALLADASDEIGGVGVAVGALHRQALRLAADQATLRMDVAALFVALSRRGQTLIQRQIQVIDDFERAEADPQRLERLFSLDHLAARMRRNEENLLVVAGGEPGRRFTRPVGLYDVVRAAAAEIEDYARVEVVDIGSVNIAAHVVGDLIHLMAELLENATVFSPPGSSVRVSAQTTGQEMTITVFDEGIGIPAAQLVEINRRLTEPTLLSSDIARTMGLYVVAHLAARHGIKVDLHSSQGGGTMATVRLSGALFTATRPLPGRPGDVLTVPLALSVAAPGPTRTALHPVAMAESLESGHTLVAAGSSAQLALPAGVVNALSLPDPADAGALSQQPLSPRALAGVGEPGRGNGTAPSQGNGGSGGSSNGSAASGGVYGTSGHGASSGAGGYDASYGAVAGRYGRRGNGTGGEAGGQASGDGYPRRAGDGLGGDYPAYRRAAVPMGTTSAGLPRRRQGAQTTPVLDPVALKTGVPDPELIRARLAGLAGGIAAARHQIQNRPSP